MSRSVLPLIRYLQQVLQRPPAIDLPLRTQIQVSTAERGTTFTSAQPDTKGHKDLWDKAYYRLGNEKKELIEMYESILTGNIDIPEGLSHQRKCLTSFRKSSYQGSHSHHRPATTSKHRLTTYISLYAIWRCLAT